RFLLDVRFGLDFRQAEGGVLIVAFLPYPRIGGGFHHRATVLVVVIGFHMSHSLRLGSRDNIGGDLDYRPRALVGVDDPELPFLRVASTHLQAITFPIGREAQQERFAYFFHLSHFILSL